MRPKRQSRDRQIDYYTGDQHQICGVYSGIVHRNRTAHFDVGHPPNYADAGQRQGVCEFALVGYYGTPQ